MQDARGRRAPVIRAGTLKRNSSNEAIDATAERRRGHQLGARRDAVDLNVDDARFGLVSRHKNGSAHQSERAGGRRGNPNPALQKGPACQRIAEVRERQARRPSIRQSEMVNLGLVQRSPVKPSIRRPPRRPTVRPLTWSSMKRRPIAVFGL